MRISDWSSDVCSSDLLDVGRLYRLADHARRELRLGDQCSQSPKADHRFRGPRNLAGDIGRSEEHKSELQSLMRNSYAVFCLQKKKPTAVFQMFKDTNKQQPKKSFTETKQKARRHTYIT